MKLVPFFFRQKHQNKFTIDGLYVFLAHAGRSVWVTEEDEILSNETILQEYCEPNGFVIDRIFLEKDTAFLEVNPEKTNLSEFFTWEEASCHPGKPECWRRFYFFEDIDGSHWWSPKGLVEAEIQGFGNVDALYRHLRTYYNV